MATQGWAEVVCAAILIFGGVTRASSRHPRQDKEKFAKLTHPGDELVEAQKYAQSAFSQRWQQCGNWQESYAELHGNILAGRAPQRYAIAEPIAGLADSLTCASTVFYISILTDRAFLIRDHDRPGSTLASGYEQPNIDWAAQPESLDKLSSAHLEQFVTGGGPLHGNETDVVRHGDLNTLADADVLIFPNCNAGMTHELFQNPRYYRRLWNMGLMPETAFSCAFWYLFSPSDPVRQSYIDVATELTTSDSFTIGIQIRANYFISDNFTSVGGSDVSCEDAQEAETEVSPFSEYFQCAQVVEDTLRSMGLRHVRWFLVSDSAKLRNCAATKYGSKLIGHRHQHRHLEHMRVGPSSAIIDSIGDHLMLASTDYVVAKYGSFGRTAALLHNQWHSFFRMLSTDPDEAIDSICKKSLTFEDIVEVLPGVR